MKTPVATELAALMRFEYFKASTERQNWHDATFSWSLPFDMLLPDFASQVGVSFVSDRGFPCEWVYSSVFGRTTDRALIMSVDQQFRQKLATIIVLLLRTTYDASKFDDDLVDVHRLDELHRGYLDFINFSVNSWIVARVDQLGEDPRKIASMIHDAVDAASAVSSARAVIDLTPDSFKPARLMVVQPNDGGR